MSLFQDSNKKANTGGKAILRFVFSPSVMLKSQEREI